jgi:hypothetical protein
MALTTQVAHRGIRVQGSKGVGRGRSLHAVRTTSPGDALAVFSAPLVAIPAGLAAKTTCSQCLSARKPVRACTGCHAVAYCGAADQKAHWAAIHRLECKAFKRVRSKVKQDWLPTPVRAAVQLLLQWEDADVREAVDWLESNALAFREGELWKDLELQALAACTYAGLETTEERLAMAADIMCKVSMWVGHGSYHTEPSSRYRPTPLIAPTSTWAIPVPFSTRPLPWSTTRVLPTPPLPSQDVKPTSVHSPRSKLARRSPYRTSVRPEAAEAPKPSRCS